MYLPFVTGVILLALFLLARAVNPAFWAQRRRFIVLGSALVIFSTAGILAYQQYQSWAGSELTKLFLPPHSGIGYFITYCLHRIFGEWIVSFLAGAIGGYGAYRLNKRFDNRFFEEEEPWMFATGIFLSGFPGFLIYILLVFHVGVLLTLAYVIMKKGRAPLYWLWLILAIFAILITNWYVPREILVRFNL
jgi:hypothetical protein